MKTKIQEMAARARLYSGPFHGVGVARYVAMADCCEMLEQIEKEPVDGGIGTVTLTTKDMDAIRVQLSALRETIG